MTPSPRGPALTPGPKEPPPSVYPDTGTFIWGPNIIMGSPGGSVVKNPPANAGDAREASSIPEWGRYPGEGNDNPL